MKKIQLIIGVLVWASLGHALTGSRDGGGGTIVLLPNDKAALLDLYLANPSFSETPVAQKLAETPFLAISRFDIMPLTQGPAAEFLAKRLKLWKANSPSLTALIANSLKERLRFFYTMDKLKRYEDFYLPEEKTVGAVKLQTQTVILFDKILGPIVYAPLWNALGLESQAGLLLHEALRHLQYTDSTALTDENIQAITANIILNAPGNQTLESPTFMGTALVTAINHSQHDGEVSSFEVIYRLYAAKLRSVFSQLKAEIGNKPIEEIENDPICGSFIRDPRVVFDEKTLFCVAWYLEGLPDALKQQLPANPSPKVVELIGQLSLRHGDMTQYWEEKDTRTPKDMFFYEAIYREVDTKKAENIISSTLDVLGPHLVRRFLNDGFVYRTDRTLELDLETATHSVQELGRVMNLYFKKHVIPSPNPNPEKSGDAELVAKSEPAVRNATWIPEFICYSESGVTTGDNGGLWSRTCLTGTGSLQYGA